MSEKSGKKRLQGIPTHLITGFLGVGKTTALRHLLAQKPVHERWAIVVNEFGEVAIDQALMDAHDDQVQIKEIPGGCICCAAGLPFQMSLTLLLSRFRPDRLLIEPTGLGHPAQIKAQIEGPAFAEVLSLKNTLCLIDPRNVFDPRYGDHPTWKDQINLADGLIFTKADLASEAQLQRALDWALALKPRRARIASIAKGALPLAWLETARVNGLSADSGHRAPAIEPLAEDTGVLGGAIGDDPRRRQPVPPPGRPWRFENQGLGAYGVGWVLSAEECFDQAALAHWLEGLALLRVKGVVRTASGWQSLNRVGDEGGWTPVEARADSRLELIADRPLAPAALEQALLACRCRDG